MKKERSELRIWWIDDETDRLKSSAQEAIRCPDQPELKGRKAELEIIKLGKKKSVAEALADFDSAKTKGHAPDLLVIDQMLNLPVEDGVVQKGSSLAVTFRDKDPTVPLVGVTGASPSDVPELQKKQFVEFFARDDLQSGIRIPDLYAIADGFGDLVNLRKFRSTQGKTNALLLLLDCPQEDLELLMNSIPGELKSSWDKETPHTLARWIWHTFLGTPGFVYDELEISTLLGLNITGFGKVSKKLAQCKYCGVFASGSRTRWWISKVRQKVRELTNSQPTSPLWELGRKLVGNNEELFSKCYGRTGRSFVPTVVAFADGTLRKRVQAHIEDTKALDTETALLGFEQRRVYFR